MHMSLFCRSSDLLLNPFLPNSNQCSHLLISDFFKRPWKIVCSTIFKIYFTNAYIHLEAKKQNSFLHRLSSISGLPIFDNVLTFDQRNHKIWFDYYMAVSYFQTDSFLFCSFHSRRTNFFHFPSMTFQFSTEDIARFTLMIWSYFPQSQLAEWIDRQCLDHVSLG